MDKKRFIKWFAVFSSVMLVAVAAVVAVVDPFFHYHKPLNGLKAVVVTPEYQCIGTVRNFDYDSIILGSSVAENYNNHWFDEGFGCTTIKAIQKSAKTTDLIYYLRESLKDHKLKNVFYSLDVSALCADYEAKFPNASLPLYMFDDNPVNDIEYLWNRDVLFEDVPYMFAMSFMGDYDEGNSYNWAQYKTFSKQGTLQQYHRLEQIKPQVPASEYEKLVDGNLKLIEELVMQNPDTKFRFIYPPYSMLWWDDAHRNGILEQYRYAIAQSADRLLYYDNVELYYFQNIPEIILNLDNYMDTVHFSAEINRYICEQMIAGKNKLTRENIVTVLDDMTALSDKIVLDYDKIIK